MGWFRAEDELDKEEDWVDVVMDEVMTLSVWRGCEVGGGILMLLLIELEDEAV